MSSKVTAEETAESMNFQSPSHKVSSESNFERQIGKSPQRASIFEQPTAWFSRRSHRREREIKVASGRSKRVKRAQDPEFVRLNAL